MIKDLYNKIITTGYDENHLSNDNAKKRIVNVMAIYAIPVLILFSIMNFYRDIIELMYADLSSAFLLLISFLYLKKTKTTILPAIGVLIAMYIIFVSLFYSTPLTMSRF